MTKKSRGFQKIIKILFLIVCLLGIVGFKLPANDLILVEKPVYIVTNERDYFRLISFSTNQENNIPILLLADNKTSEKADVFLSYYQGIPNYLSTQQVDELVRKHFPDNSEIIVTDSSIESMLFGTLISSVLETPFFVETIPVEILNNENLSSIIMIGEVKLTANINTEELDSFEKAQNYYNQLVDKTDTSVVISDPDVYSIGAEMAAYHRGKVFFNIEDGKNSNTDNLIWVTLPGNLGQTDFSRLYASDSNDSVNKLYTQNIGVITGFTIEDMSLLLARTFAYHDMQGEWKNNYVVASAFSNLPSSIINENGNIIQSIGAADLTVNNFTQAITTANYVFAYAHGNVSGLRFNDGSWPDQKSTFSVPPLLFVAEACSTMDFNDKEMDQSIALTTISSGAVAFIGSMEIGGVSFIGNLPYSNSTIQMPLGELVRMQNSILMDFATDNARVVLVGDPTFFQTTQQLSAVVSISSDNKNGSVFEIKDAVPNSDIYVRMESKKAIIRGIATLENGNKVFYLRGGNYFARPLGVVSNKSDQTILFTWPGGDGKIVFHDNWTLPLVFMDYLGDSLLGVKVLLLDLATISNFPWGYTILVFGLLLLSRKRLMVKKNHLVLFLLGSFLFSGLISLIYFEVSFGIRIPVTLALFMWTFLSLCFFDKKEYNIQKIILSTFLFLIPFLYGLFISLAMGASGKTSVIVLKGVILLGISFFVLQFLTKKIPHRVKVTLPSNPENI